MTTLNYSELTKKQQKQVQESTGYSHEQLEREDEMLILAADFEEYAQELAEEIGAISSENQWPATCIDWEWAARELRMDYFGASIDGQSYYMRAF